MEKINDEEVKVDLRPTCMIGKYLDSKGLVKILPPGTLFPENLRHVKTCGGFNFWIKMLAALGVILTTNVAEALLEYFSDAESRMKSPHAAIHLFAGMELPFQLVEYNPREQVARGIRRRSDTNHEHVACLKQGIYYQVWTAVDSKLKRLISAAADAGSTQAAPAGREEAKSLATGSSSARGRTPAVSLASVQAGSADRAYALQIETEELAVEDSRQSETRRLRQVERAARQAAANQMAADRAYALQIETEERATAAANQMDF